MRRVGQTLALPHTRTLRGVIGGVHIAFASVCFYRPNLFEMYSTWQGFQDIAPPLHWGLVSVTLGVLLLGLNPAKLPIVLTQFLSVCFFALVGLQTTEFTGYNTGTPIYALLSFYGLICLFTSATHYLECLGWYVHLQWRVHRWRRVRLGGHRGR